MAYATTADVEARWRPLSAAEKTTATALLDDAAILIQSECPDIDQRIADGLLDPGAPLIVSVRLVKRAMAAGVSGFDNVSSFQQTAGPFQQNTSFVNPSGDMYLTRADRKLLGCGQQRAYMIDMAPNASWPVSGLE